MITISALLSGGLFLLLCLGMHVGMMFMMGHGMKQNHSTNKKKL